MRTEKRMVRRIATISKDPVAPGLLKEEKFIFQRKIQKLVTCYKIQKELIINSDQTPLFYVIVSNATLEFSGEQSVPVKGKINRKQITGTFSITAAGKFLPVQLIYAGNAQRCHPKGISFPDGFDVIHSKNHCSNEILAIQHLDNIMMPYLEAMREELELSKN